MKNIIRIDQHIYEVNNRVKFEYHVYYGITYSIKARSELSKREIEFIEKNGHNQYFHF